MATKPLTIYQALEAAVAETQAAKARVEDAEAELQRVRKQAEDVLLTARTAYQAAVAEVQAAKEAVLAAVAGVAPGSPELKRRLG